MSKRINQAGVILPTLIILMIALTMIGLTLGGFALNQFFQAHREVSVRNALLTAEAGAEATLHELNNDSDFEGFASEVSFLDEANRLSTYETEVTDGDLQNEKIIISTGRVYSHPDTVEPVAVRRIRLLVVGTTADNYSARTGPGGLIMSNTATITNGDVRVNGFIQMSGHSRIGTSNNPLDVYVAHHNCPEGGGADYPEQCTSGQPISISHPAHIYGEVHATNQTDGSGMSAPGLIEGSSAEPVGLPTYDRQDHIDRANASGISLGPGGASCSANQTKTWLPNTKVVGSARVVLENNCSITIQGDIWIEGGLVARNASSLIVDNSLTEPPVIMVDGSRGFTIDNNADIVANENGVGVHIITFWSAAACSPNCTSVSGQDLYDSGGTTTIDIKNSGSAAGSFFHSYWSKVVMSNSGTVGGVIGQTIELSNSANIYFGDQLSSGASVWSIKSYQQLFD